MIQPMWKPTEHTDQENLQWAWLRAVEWGYWPIFISQPVAPIALIVFSWWFVFLAVTAANVVWSVFIRYRIVIPALAFWGALFVRLKWIACPLASFFLWRKGMKGTAALAFFWPLVIMLIPRGSTQIGVIQRIFMRSLGYEAAERAA